MGKNSAFDRLVLELTPAERSKMLEKLKMQQLLQDPEDVLMKQEEEPHIHSAEYAAHLTWFNKILLFLKSLLFNKSKTELIKEQLLRDVAKKVHSNTQNLIDASGKMLLKGFYDELLRLEKAIRYFDNIFSKILTHNIAGFYVFLVSLYIGETHKNLAEFTDPWIIEKNQPNLKEHEVRTAMQKYVDSVLAQLTESVKFMIYNDVHLLFILQELVRCPVKTLLESFLSIDGKYETPLSINFTLLEKLNDLLHEINEPPSVYLLDALYFFYHGEKYKGNPDEYNDEVTKEASTTIKNFTIINNFCKKVYLNNITALAAQNPDYEPKLVSGGEDWLSLVKKYWKERIEKNYVLYSFQKKSEQLQNEINYFVKEPFQSRLLFINEKSRETLPSVKYARVLKLIETIYHNVFIPEMNKYLKILLVEGDFYKKDNRQEFTESYNLVLQIPEMLATFDAMLSPEGDIGRQYIITKNELSSKSVLTKKTESIMLSIDFESETIIKKVTNAIEKLVFILRGILSRQSNSVYDTLVNLSKIDGRNNKQFLENLEKIKGKLERAFYLINDVYALVISKSKLDRETQNDS